MQLLFADQLGQHFETGAKQLLPIVKNQFRKRRYHRQKAHLILYSLRAKGLGANVETIELSSYRDLSEVTDLSQAIKPSSRPMLALAESLEIELLEHRGFCSSRDQFHEFAKGKKQLRLEDFYRLQRQRLGILHDGIEPEGGRWNFDSENRLPPPKTGLGLAEPWWPSENDLDAQVRAELDELETIGVEFIGRDGPRRFAATVDEAELAVQDFLENRLDLFGPYEDAMNSKDWVMAHSMLSVPMNLGLIDPITLTRRVEERYRQGLARLESVEGFIRQVIGWRDYVWQLYWHFGEDYVRLNELGAAKELPLSIKNLDATAVQANCVKQTITDVDDHSWAHHIPRLMILGNLILQRGYDPKAANDWFIDAFADGTPWVMPANVIGMALYADGGLMSTKPYAAGGSYINRMSNYCSGCPFDPKLRVGEKACPMTAGYWDFIGRHQERFSKNHRMFQVMAGYRRLGDKDAIHNQESTRTGF